MPTDYRELAISTHGHECQLCGADDVIEVHHVDGDRSNNDDADNLLPVCPDCHVGIHAGREGFEEWYEKIEQHGSPPGTRIDPGDMDRRNVEWVRMSLLPVHDSGRVTLPKDVRDSFGIGHGDLLTLRLVVGGEYEHFHRVLDSKNKITIPARLRDKHGIGDGDSVDAELQP